MFGNDLNKSNKSGYGNLKSVYGNPENTWSRSVNVVIFSAGAVYPALRTCNFEYLDRFRALELKNFQFSSVNRSSPPMVWVCCLSDGLMHALSPRLLWSLGPCLTEQMRLKERRTKGWERLSDFPCQIAVSDDRKSRFRKVGNPFLRYDLYTFWRWAANRKGFIVVVRI